MPPNYKITKLPISRAHLLLLILACLSRGAVAQEPLLLERDLALPRAPVENAPIYLESDELQAREQNELEAWGDVRIRQRGQTMRADHLRYLRNENEVFADGEVELEQGSGDRLEGPELQLDLDTRVGRMPDVEFAVGETGGRGDADTLFFEGPDQYRLERARYTTCPVGVDDWYLRVNDLDLDRTANIGYARHSTVVFKGVPILYLPWMSFPLRKERKTGFLTPSFGSTDTSGLEFTIPFYWNIAPNRDATFRARVLSKRGVLLGSEYRYLDRDYYGQLDTEVLPSDKLYGKTRYAASLRHAQRFGQHWNLNLDLNKVSDTNYFTDLATRVAVTSQSYLPRDAILSYAEGPWAFSARVQKFQTLQGPPVYERVPQLLLSANKQFGGFESNLYSEYVNFRHASSPNGKRLTIYPSLLYPMTSVYGYITPKIGVHSTNYDLDQGTTALPDRTRTLPIFSVDSGIFFEREFGFRDRNYLQTLEPRLYYVHIPYRDQSQIPNFDTAEADLNFAQIFTENQFSGGDRINDANQLTLALTSRFIESESGRERLRAAVAQRYYLTPQRVTLNTTARTRNSSDILAALSGQISDAWNLDATWQYNTSDNRSEKFNLGARYSPNLGRVINFNYRFTRESLREVDVSSQWSFGRGWYGLGRVNYSLQERKLLQALVGIEYNAGCWQLRVVGNRFRTGAQQDNNAIFIQLELNGLSRIGSNPLDVLRQNIYGYVKSDELPASTAAP